MFRMIWLSGSVLLLMASSVSSLGVKSEEDQATIVLRYPRETLTPARGTSVQLSCKAHFKFTVCGRLRVVWIRDGKELTDPSKYFTTVTERLAGGDMRDRQVVMEILNLRREDSGTYQCSAECEGVDSAVGHNIVIDVKD